MQHKLVAGNHKKRVFVHVTDTIHDNQVKLFSRSCKFNLGSCVVPLLIGKKKDGTYLMGATVVFLANSFREKLSAGHLVNDLFRKFEQQQVPKKDIIFFRLFGGHKYLLDSTDENPVAQDNILITKAVLADMGKRPILPSLTGKAITAVVELVGHTIVLNTRLHGEQRLTERQYDLRDYF